MDKGWLTTALILLPVAGALLVWILPLNPFATASTAMLIALGEVALWIDALARFDFDQPGLQLDQQQSWFSDLNVSYHVGMYGFSIWLVGLTAVVLAAATGYAWWTGRERPRAYYGLMLLLTGAIVGVFVAQDLLLFYVFWEAMLIPLYFLVGVWGGAGRLRATLLFVIYTMAGSLLMLAASVALGLSQGTFDLVASASWRPSPSRHRSSPSMPGCRRRTASRRPRWRPCSAAWSRRQRRTASCESRSPSSPSPSPTSARRSSCSLPAASSTGRCWPFARPTCAA
jgi:NADH:ubiquinone oxidoreductase subunit 4 (subunit M)